MKTTADPVRAVSSPLTPADLAPLDPECHTVVFRSSLSEADLRSLGELLAGYPDVGLRVYGNYDRAITDLDFLRFFPSLRRFAIEIDELRSLDGLSYLSPDLEELSIGGTRPKLRSLKMLERFCSLRTLYIEGQPRDVESLGALRSLEELTLRSVTLPNLSVLEPLARLRSLDIKLGGTRDLGLLPRVGRLEYVELWLIRGLDDVSSLAEIATLEGFLLQRLRNVTRLPSFVGSPLLRHASLDAMKGVSDLGPLAAAPNLERLDLISMQHLEPEALLPFVGHATLKHGTWGLGSDRKNAMAWDLLPLGEPPFNYDAYKARQALRRG